MAEVDRETSNEDITRYACVTTLCLISVDRPMLVKYNAGLNMVV